MSSNNRMCLTLAVALFIGSPDVVRAQAQSPRLKATIDSAVGRMTAAANSVNAKGIFAETASDFVLVNNGTLYPSRDSALATFSRSFKHYRRQDIQVGEANVRALSPTLALYTAI